MAADFSSVTVELLDPTTCKRTELVKHLLLNCVAVMRVKVCISIGWILYLAIWSLNQKMMQPLRHRVSLRCGSLPSKSWEKCQSTWAGWFWCHTFPSLPSPLVCTHCTLLGFEVRAYRAAVQSVPHTHVSDMNFLPNIAGEYTGIFAEVLV